MEDFVLKLEEVGEKKVAYFYTPSPKKKWALGSIKTITLTDGPVGRV